MNKIGVIGSGSWGTALAVAASESAAEVKIFSRNPDITKTINNKNENEKYLPEIKLPKNISATDEISNTLNSDALLLVTPAQTLRSICKTIKNEAKAKNVTFSNTPLIICCKGIEENSFKLMSEVAQDIFPENPILILSGPNFASEIAKGLPACASLACENLELAEEISEKLGSARFRLYTTKDIIGSQIGGAVKNVLAIACGIAIGKGLGENARAALVTRGIAEIGKLCSAKGGNIQTLLGLSGIGDIMLTCGSLTSRNMSFGFQLGQGKELNELINNNNKITEGVPTSLSVTKLADSLNVEMPICEAIKNILYDQANIDNVIKDLLRRPASVEFA